MLFDNVVEEKRFPLAAEVTFEDVKAVEDSSVCFRIWALSMLPADSKHLPP